jgi:hypothetical protein
MCERKEPFDIAFSGEKPVILLGSPDLTLLRRKVSDTQCGHVAAAD